MKKWMASTLAMVFLFSLAFSFALTVTSERTVAAEDNCCIIRWCPLGGWEYGSYCPDPRLPICSSAQHNPKLCYRHDYYQCEVRCNEP